MARLRERGNNINNDKDDVINDINDGDDDYDDDINDINDGDDDDNAAFSQHQDLWNSGSYQDKLAAIEDKTLSKEKKV